MPEHNGVAEQLNRTLVECVHNVLHMSGLSRFLWGGALLHTIWVKNRSATWALDSKTPYKMLYGKKPYLGDLPVWGVKCWTLDCSGSKLDDCACEGCWVAFDAESTAHWIYLPNKCTIVIEHNVTFQKVDELVSITINEPLATNGNTTMNVPVPSAPHAVSNCYKCCYFSFDLVIFLLWTAPMEHLMSKHSFSFPHCAWLIYIDSSDKPFSYL